MKIAQVSIIIFEIYQIISPYIRMEILLQGVLQQAFSHYLAQTFKLGCNHADKKQILLMLEV